MDKEALRTQMRARLLNLSSAEHERQSALIQTKLHAHLSKLTPNNICLYLPTPTEPTLNIAHLYSITPNLYCPKFIDGVYYFVTLNPSDNLQEGPYTIQEPETTELISQECLQARDTVFLVPGLAFSPHGDRLGQGKGIYDRLLAALPGTKMGLCFDVQMSEECVSLEGDVGMDVVVCGL